MTEFFDFVSTIFSVYGVILITLLVAAIFVETVLDE